MDIKEIASGLPGLGAKELRELRARIDFLLKGQKDGANNGGNGGTEDPAQIVLSAILGACQDRGLESRPLGRLVRSQGYPAFAEKVPALLQSLGLRDMNLSRTRFVLKLGFKLITDELIEMGVPVSASVLMNHVHRLPGVMDVHFPGYRGAGMLKLLARGEHE